ncbi:MAG: PorV/PorQ family protein [Elusimicrobia bacterium]|nr:PorV/PorQ family protein [Elusimicrobiota bacterium]
MKLALLACLCAAAAARAGDSAPVMPFLFLDSSARPASLGGAYASLAAGPEAMRYNPAGLGFLKRSQAALTHTEHFQGVAHDNACLALADSGAARSGLGFMINSVGFGSLQRTTLSNPRGTGLGTFGIRDWEVAAGYGRLLAEGWPAAGISLKYLREDIDGWSAQAVALDVGTLWDLKPVLSLPITAGMSLQNLGASVKYQSSREPLPGNMKLGASWRPWRAGLVALDLNRAFDGRLTAHAGMELAPTSSAALRFGYNGRNDAGSGLTMGGGLEWGRFAYELALAPFGSLGNAYSLTVSCRLDRPALK